MGIVIHSELCLGCGLCDNVFKNEEAMRLMGSGIMTIIKGDVVEKFIQDKSMKRRLIRSCPFNAIIEVDHPTPGTAVPQIKHNSIEQKEVVTNGII